MKSLLKKVLMLACLLSISLASFAQIDMRIYRQGSYVSQDTMFLNVDPNDNSGTGATSTIIYFNIYNLSHTTPEACYLEAEWTCSNSSAFYQFCQEYPSDYTSGTCHTFHSSGIRTYDDYNYTIPADTSPSNYLRCHFFIYDYSVEQNHEKVCRFLVKRRNTHEVLDSMYLVIRRGNLPCNMPQGSSGINSVSADAIAEIYPNPARDVFTIATEQDQLAGCVLYSIDGKIIVDRKPGNEKRFDINVADIANGVYFLKLTDKQGKSFFKKIVVDH